MPPRALLICVYVTTFKGVERIQHIRKTMYRAEPDGLAGNDDVGQMSAWFAMSSMGFYPLNPVGGEYILGAPLFERIDFNLTNGKRFAVIRKGPENGSVEKVTLNGKEITKNSFTHKQLIKGGELVFYMNEAQ